MTWQRLLEPDIQKFIKEHEKADVAALALSGDSRAEPLVLDQIKSRQKAAKKVPEWLEREGVIFPSPSVMEQASSATTARYKASLFEGESFVDLSGGAGVDAWGFSQSFERGAVVERDESSAELLAHNLDVEVVCATAEDYVANMKPCDLAYIDPQRRDALEKGGRKGKFRLEDCSPDVLSLLPMLLEKAQTVMVKTSPMLDIWAACEALGNLSGVHVVEWRGECKEVLYVLKSDAGRGLENIPVRAVLLNDDGAVLSDFSFTKAQERDANPEYSQPLRYFYEPGPAFQKAGGFKALAKTYGVKKLHPDTHLYTSVDLINDFPGRAFEVLGLYSPKGRDLPLKKANLSVRNFPQKTEILRKKLGLQDGGDDYLFACTLMDEKKAILHGQKAQFI